MLVLGISAEVEDYAALHSALEETLGAPIKQMSVPPSSPGAPKRASLMFTEEEHAKQAVALGEVEVLGATVRVRPRRVYPNPRRLTVPDDEEGIARMVIVTGLADCLSSPEARKYVMERAGEVGTVVDAFVGFQPKRPWEHTDVVVVTMASAADAHAARERLEGRKVSGVAWKARAFHADAPEIQPMLPEEQRVSTASS